MKKSKDVEKTPLRMEKHLKSMGGLSLIQYQYWCEDNGFKYSLKKTTSELDQEYTVFKNTLSTRRKIQKIDKNPKPFIIDACDGNLNSQLIDRPNWKEFFEAIKNSNPKKEFRDSLKTLLLRIHKVSDLLIGSIIISNRPVYYFKAFVQINNRKNQWIRNIEEWTPNSHNVRKQFTSLVNHLFGKYFIPDFMDFVWFRDDQGSYKYRNWYLHLGKGKNIRTAKTPIKFTKKIAHYFMQAPSDYAIEEAIKYGEIKSLNGNIRLVEAILGSAIRTSFSNNDFWVSVYKFFIQNPFIDKRNISPVIDYINHQKFLDQEQIVGPGQTETAPPPQPNFSMQGRDPNVLLKRVSEWHEGLSKTSSAKNLYFRKSGIREFIKGVKKKWSIIELLSGQELIEEGKRMHHCIATYANSCASGKCSIWSMSYEEEGETKPLVTIEVNKNGLILECRGKYNRYPTESEISILKEWAIKERLVISDYVFG